MIHPPIDALIIPLRRKGETKMCKRCVTAEVTFAFSPDPSIFFPECDMNFPCFQ